MVNTLHKKRRTEKLSRLSKYMALTLGALICILVVFVHADMGMTKADTKSLAHPRLAKKIVSIRPETDDQGFKVHIIADGKIKDHNAFRVLIPHRLVMDLPGVQCSLKQKTLPVDSLLVKNIQLHTSNKDKLRVVFDLFPIAELPYKILSKDNQLIVLFGSVAGSPIVKHREKTQKVPPVSKPEKKEEVKGGYVGKAALSPARKITAVEVETHDQGTKMHIVADGKPTRYTAFHLSDPARLVVDVFGVRSAMGKETMSFPNPLVKGVRLGTSYGQVRVVFDLVPQGELPYQIVQKNDRLVVFVKQISEISKTELASKAQSTLPAPSELTQERPFPSVPPGKIILHISSFKEKTNAENEVQRLKGYGYKTFIASEEVLGESWLRVYIGIFDHEQAARRIGSELREKGSISYFKPFKIG
jgi:hypothetical protein